MKRFMMCVAMTATAALGLGVGASSVYADHIPGDPDEHGPYPLPPTSAVEVAPPVPVETTIAPVLTPPPLVDSPLPSTGTDSLDMLTIAAVAGVTGAGLVVVARSRRRKPALES